MRWPLTISGLTVMVSRRPADPISRFHAEVAAGIVLATSRLRRRRARSSGESVALTSLRLLALADSFKTFFPNSSLRHSGMVGRTRPGISRFRV